MGIYTVGFVDLKSHVELKCSRHSKNLLEVRRSIFKKCRFQLL